MEQKHERMSSTLFQTSANQYKNSTFHRKAVGNQKYAQRNFIMLFIFTFPSMYMNKYNSKQLLSQLCRSLVLPGHTASRVTTPHTLQNLRGLQRQPLPMGPLHCGTSAGELLVQAGLGFEHMPPYCCSDSRQRV